MDTVRILETIRDIKKVSHMLTRLDKELYLAFESDELQHALFMTQAGLSDGTPTLNDLVTHVDTIEEKIKDLVLRKINSKEAWNTLTRECYSLGGENDTLVENQSELRDLYSPLIYALSYGETYLWATQEYSMHRHIMWEFSIHALDKTPLCEYVKTMLTRDNLLPLRYDLLKRFYLEISREFHIPQSEEIHMFLESVDTKKITEDGTLINDLRHFFALTVSYMMVLHVQQVGA